MLKIWVCFCALLAITIAEEINYHAHPQYSFQYGVNDPHTKDVKKQWETRDGDKVQGSYSFKEADGTVRIVDYHANDMSGFNAVVRREGYAVHPQVTVHAEEAVHETEHKVPQIRTQVPVVLSKVPIVFPQVPVNPEAAIHQTIETVSHHPHLAKVHEDFVSENV